MGGSVYRRIEFLIIFLTIWKVTCLPKTKYAAVRILRRDLGNHQEVTSDWSRGSTQARSKDESRVSELWWHITTHIRDPRHMSASGACFRNSLVPSLPPDWAETMGRYSLSGSLQKSLVKDWLILNSKRRLGIRLPQFPHCIIFRWWSETKY